MTKRKIDFEETAAFTGYLYNVSEIKQSADRRTRYFTGTFQTSKEDSKRLVSFAPQRHATYVQAAVMSSPVKLTNAKLSPNKDGTLGIIVNNRTELEVSATDLPFKKTENSTPTLTVQAPSQELSLKDLQTENQSVSVIVKFHGYTAPKRTVETKYGPRTNQTGLLTDVSGHAKLTAWEDKITLLQQGKCYEIKNLVTRRFDGQIVLNTTASTNVTEVPPLPLIDDDLDITSMLSNTKENITIMHLEIIAVKRCGNRTCNAVVTENTSDTTFRCVKCNRKQQTKNLKSVVKGTITATLSSSEEKTYHIYEDAICALLTQQQKQHLEFDVDRFEDYLLEESDFEVECASDSNVITKIKPSA